jgi:hypothetical protein
LIFNSGRRRLLGQTGAIFSAACLAQTLPLRHVFAAEAVSKKAPPDVGRKFYPNGKVRPFLGNTIICHLPQQDQGFETFDALLDIYRELPDHAFSRKIALLPPSSYHMTIFGGADDQERKPGLWPADVPLDASIEACNDYVANQLKHFSLGTSLPIRMRVNDAQPPVHPDPLLIDLVPVDEAEERKLRKLRDRLADVLKIHTPHHDTYSFHISLAYQIEWFDAAEQADYVAARQRWREQLKRRAPIIEFGAPEYCTLNDMYAFRRRFFLT